MVPNSNGCDAEAGLFSGLLFLDKLKLTPFSCNTE